jgi:predicted  nucleic acid-binding Zn-ribbon protein
MDKKLKAGDIDKKSYEKRINQLKSDLKKAQSRIEEINKEL